MLRKSQLKPHKIFEGIEGDFYKNSYSIELMNGRTLSFNYFDFHRKKLHLLEDFFDEIISTDDSISEENKIIKCHKGFFDKPIHFVKIESTGHHYIILVAFDESQPGIFWLGIESVWEILDREMKAPLTG